MTRHIDWNQECGSRRFALCCWRWPWSSRPSPAGPESRTPLRSLPRIRFPPSVITCAQGSSLRPTTGLDIGTIASRVSCAANRRRPGCRWPGTMLSRSANLRGSMRPYMRGDRSPSDNGARIARGRRPSRAAEAAARAKTRGRSSICCARQPPRLSSACALHSTPRPLPCPADWRRSPRKLAMIRHSRLLGGVSLAALSLFAA